VYLREIVFCDFCTVPLFGQKALQGRTAAVKPVIIFENFRIQVKSQPKGFMISDF